jgi:hypothetical protein
MYGFILAVAESLTILSQLLCIWNIPIKYSSGNETLRLCIVDKFQLNFVSSSNTELIDFGSYVKCADFDKEFILLGRLVNASAEVAALNCSDDRNFLYRIEFHKSQSVVSFQHLPGNINVDHSLSSISSLVIGMNTSSSSHWISDGYFNTDRLSSTFVSCEPSGESISFEDSIQGRFLVGSSAVCEFPISLFGSSNSHASSQSYQPSLSLNPSLICSNLRSSVGVTSATTRSITDPLPIIPFHLISDHPYRYSRDHLSYWLDYCSISLPTIHLRGIVMKEIEDDPLNNDYLKNIESICTVKDIEGFSSKHEFLKNSHYYSKHQPLYCLEHFLEMVFFDNYIYPLMEREKTAFQSEERPDTESDGEGKKRSKLSHNVVFQYHHWLSSNTLLRNKIIQFQETLSLLRAMYNVAMSFGSTNDDEDDYYLFTIRIKAVGIDKMMLPEEDLATSFETKSKVEETAAVDSSLVSTPSVVTEIEANEKKEVAELELRWNDAIQRLTNSPILPSSLGDVYIVVFVSYYHVYLVQKQIESWKKQCQSEVCHLVIKYFIFPFASEEESRIDKNYQSFKHCRNSSARDKDHKCTEEEKQDSEDVSVYYHSSPSLRSVLLEFNRFLIEIYSKDNVIILLNGLKAVYSLITPASYDKKYSSFLNEVSQSSYCSSSFKANFFPPIYYGMLYTREANGYCLSSEIMVALNSVDEELEVAQPFIHALIGRTRTLVMFFDYWRDFYLTVGKSDEELETSLMEAMIRWSSINPKALSLDMEQRIFDPFHGIKDVTSLIEEDLRDAHPSFSSLSSSQIVGNLMVQDLVQFHSAYRLDRGHHSSPFARLDFHKFLSSLSLADLLSENVMSDLFRVFFSFMGEFVIQRTVVDSPSTLSEQSNPVSCSVLVDKWPVLLILHICLSFLTAFPL